MTLPLAVAGRGHYTYVPSEQVPQDQQVPLQGKVRAVPKTEVGTIRIVSVKRGVLGDEAQFELAGSSGHVYAKSKRMNTPYKKEVRHWDEHPDFPSYRSVWNDFLASLISEGWVVVPTDPRRWHSITLQRSTP